MVQPRGSRFKSDIRIKPEKARAPEPETRMCEAPGCIGPGNCRVSKSPRHLNEYLWYCSQHARTHNEAWDYFKDMDDAEIQRFREESMFGHRPTWPLGKRGAKARMGQTPLGGVNDSHAMFAEDGDTSTVRRPERHLTRLQIMAMDTMQLAHNATLIEIKARYKELVKRFHPDANGGDRGAEERLKQVIKAYGVLRASGLLT
ncbi:MAG TPA: J domain-containing protein [Rhizomicrobium sp.]|nr:J domain-containing protein [Rhizomicrobium sp.]